MSASQEHWSLRAERRQALAAGLVALAAFGAAWGMLHRGFYARDQIVDTPVYQRYGDAMLDGRVPYRDFRVEYPPAALPVFLLPAIGDRGDELAYRRSFERLMALCGLLAVAGAALCLIALRAEPERVYAALAFVALAPLALGSVILTRFDLWPAALAVLGLATLLDVFTAYFFTRPMVVLLGRNRLFTEARWLGVARGLAAPRTAGDAA
jgi:hypothetical protein